MPFPSGRCGFCDTHLGGQPTRAAHEPPIVSGPATELIETNNYVEMQAA